MDTTHILHKILLSQPSFFNNRNVWAIRPGIITRQEALELIRTGLFAIVPQSNPREADLHEYYMTVFNHSDSA